MTLRRQDIVYIVLIYLKIKSSAGYYESNLAEVSLKGIDYINAVKLFSSLTEAKQNVFGSNRMVMNSIDPDGSVETTKMSEDIEEVAVAFNINVTSVLKANASLSYALIDTEGRTSAEEKFNQFEQAHGEEMQMLCAEGYENNGNCTVVNQTCFDDNLPCNATEAEYMQFLFDYMYPKTSEWILIFAHGLVFITGLVGNALVCVAVYTNYSMRTVTNVFIVNLAIADFLVILVCLPPSVVWDVTETWFLGQSMCKIVLYFQTVSVTVSVLTLTFISVDRWYAICFPLRYRTKISRAIASVSFIWIVALLSDIPEFLALHLKKPKLRFESVLFTQCGTTWDLRTEMNFYLTQLVLLYILPLLLMMIAYFKIVRILWKSDTIPGHRESRTHQYSCGSSLEEEDQAPNLSGKNENQPKYMLHLCQLYELYWSLKKIEDKKVETRYKCVFKCTKEAIDNNNKSGAVRDETEYDDEINDIVQQDDSIVANTGLSAGKYYQKQDVFPARAATRNSHPDCPVEATSPSTSSSSFSSASYSPPTLTPSQVPATESYLSSDSESLPIRKQRKSVHEKIMEKVIEQRNEPSSSFFEIKERRDEEKIKQRERHNDEKFKIMKDMLEQMKKQKVKSLPTI